MVVQTLLFMVFSQRNTTTSITIPAIIEIYSVFSLIEVVLRLMDLLCFLNAHSFYAQFLPEEGLS